MPKKHQTIEKVARSDFRRGGICNFSALKAEEERSVVNCHWSDIDACVCQSRVVRDKKVRFLKVKGYLFTQTDSHSSYIISQ